MKKRKIPLEKKLSLNKATVALLNSTQQDRIAGGLPPLTLGTLCQNTQNATCATIPPGRQYCVLCDD